MDYGKLTKVIRALSLEAGARIMEIYQRDDFGVMLKDDNSPVSIADKEADQIISAGLRAAFPQTGLVTEEQAQSHQLSAGEFLIVDPLDGTKEFIHRRNQFTVNIAYVVDGVPVRGIVYAPAIGRLFYTTADGTAVEEKGRFSLHTHGPLQPLSAQVADPAALRIVASQSHRDAQTESYIQKYQVREIKSAGSSLKFCLIASGDADLYPRLGRTMEWDTAAGDAILRAAGGSVVHFDTRAPLEYGKAGYENPHFIAHAGGVKVL